jgi:hypothetical protein
VTDEQVWGGSDSCQVKLKIFEQNFWNQNDADFTK